MYQMLRLTIAAMAVVFASFPTSVSAQVAATQIMLTEKHLGGFIAAQKDVSAIVEKMQSAAFSNQASAKYEAELKAVIKKHGFKDFAEYEAVAANISLVMMAIDPQTKAFMDPQMAIKKEIEDASADKTIRFLPLPASDRFRVLYRRGRHGEYAHSYILAKETGNAFQETTVEIVVAMLQDANQHGKVDSKMNAGFGEAADERAHFVKLSLAKYEDAAR